MFYQPFDLLLYHFLGRDKHVFQDLHELGLEGRIGHAFPHLHYLDNGLLEGREEGRKVEGRGREGGEGGGREGGEEGREGGKVGGREREGESGRIGESEEGEEREREEGEEGKGERKR